MSKKGGLILTSIIVAILSISFLVSAQQYSPPVAQPGSLTGLFQDTWNGASDVLRIVFEPVLGSTSDPAIASSLGIDPNTNGVLFTKVLFFLIILFVTVIGLDNLPIFNNRKWVVWTLGAVVSLLAVRFVLTVEWIETILLPYSFWGIFVVSFLPFVLFIYVVSRVDKRWVRKMLWVAGGVVFLGLYLSRAPDIAAHALGAGKSFNPANIYAITAVLCLILFLWDKTIQAMIARARVENDVLIQSAALVSDIVTDVGKERVKLTASPPAYGADPLSSGTYRNVWKALKSRAAGSGDPMAIAQVNTLPHKNTW